MDFDDPIPPLESAEDPFTSPEELRQRWRALMGPLGFSEPLVWVAPVHPDHTLHKALIQVERTLVPDSYLADLLMLRLSELIDGNEDHVSGFALLLTRPGSNGVSHWDRGWARLLANAARVFDVPVESIFRANARDVREVPLVADEHTAA
ncbi:hypothetical protein [uncultured Williamsia sp.]|uniref:hypothetical protein n=1 Tax=uncultured Williamsia sp. TaxID=259311 RepID=UPI00262C99B8|nr:hypothetical protein [uncultured Williamsia sp.]